MELPQTPKSFRVFQRLRTYVKLLEAGAGMLVWTRSSVQVQNVHVDTKNHCLVLTDTDGNASALSLNLIVDVIPETKPPTELLELLGKEVLRLIDYSSLRLLELVFESNRSLRFVIVDKKTWDVWYHGLAFLCGEVCSKTLNTHSYAALASSMLIYICMQMCIHFPFIVSLAEGLVSCFIPLFL